MSEGDENLRIDRDELLSPFLAAAWRDEYNDNIPLKTLFFVLDFSMDNEPDVLGRDIKRILRLKPKE